MTPSNDDGELDTSILFRHNHYLLHFFSCKAIYIQKYYMHQRASYKVMMFVMRLPISLLILFSRFLWLNSNYLNMHISQPPSFLLRIAPKALHHHLFAFKKVLQAWSQLDQTCSYKINTIVPKNPIQECPTTHFPHFVQC